ncbi:helix-turn-helix domain-containing protein [Cryptosporangium minutisporangium]|uniref:IclR family transcriptional regulator n=1 Tax=Cryptosporangium minutisporangium TaxID=113569 RepID=A0ABP6SQB3_9ACTN
MSRPSPQTERLIDLVDLLASAPTEEFTLADIARAAGLGKPTVHPMVVALARRGWLLRDPGTRTYRLGPALVAAGRAAAEGNPVLTAARPVVRDLAAATGLVCVALVAGGVPGEEDDLVVGEIADPADDRRPSAPTGQRWRGHPRGLRPGDRIPPRPPLGAVQVAWSDPETIDRWLDRLDAEQRADAAGELAPALAAIRERGWALEVGDQLRERLGRLVADFDADQRNAEHAAALRRVLTEIGRAFGVTETLPTAISPDGQYRASVVNAPVFDAAGGVAVVLCLLCVREGHRVPLRTGAEIVALGTRLRASAESLTHGLGGRWPPPFA